MKASSNLLSAIGVFVFMTTCSGQRTPCEKPLMHFAVDIIKIDSILTGSSNDDRYRGSCIRLRNIKFDTNRVWFELNCDKGSGKRASVCPVITVLDRPKKI